jgi:hypothetical protein
MPALNNDIRASFLLTGLGFVSIFLLIAPTTKPLMSLPDIVCVIAPPVLFVSSLVLAIRGYRAVTRNPDLHPQRGRALIAAIIAAVCLVLFLSLIS